MGPDGLEMVEVAKKNTLTSLDTSKISSSGPEFPDTAPRPTDFPATLSNLLPNTRGAKRCWIRAPSCTTSSRLRSQPNLLLLKMLRVAMVLIGGQSSSGTFTAEEIAALPTDVVNNPAVRISLQRTIFGTTRWFCSLGKIGTLNKLPSDYWRSYFWTGIFTLRRYQLCGQY